MAASVRVVEYAITYSYAFVELPQRGCCSDGVMVDAVCEACVSHPQRCVSKWCGLVYAVPVRRMAVKADSSQLRMASSKV